MNKLWLGLPNTVEHTTLKFSPSSKSSFHVFKICKSGENEFWKKTQIINSSKSRDKNTKNNGYKWVNISKLKAIK